MGYRMRIYPEGKPSKYVGDDHKFYGYKDFDTVKQSFTYLYPFIIDQNSVYRDYETPEDAYDLISAVQYGPKVRLTDAEYATFMDLYLADIEKCWVPNNPDAYDDIKRIRNYMTNMSNIPGNKVLCWS